MESDLSCLDKISSFCLGKVGFNESRNTEASYFELINVFNKMIHYAKEISLVRTIYDIHAAISIFFLSVFLLKNKFSTMNIKKQGQVLLTICYHQYLSISIDLDLEIRFYCMSKKARIVGLSILFSKHDLSYKLELKTIFNGLELFQKENGFLITLVTVIWIHTIIIVV